MATKKSRLGVWSAGNLAKRGARRHYSYMRERTLRFGWTGLACSLLMAGVAVDGFARTSEDAVRMEQRKRMIEKDIKRRGIKDEAVLRAMEQVPRHEFVSNDLRRYAYADRPLPIGQGQTISQPYMVAVMTELLGVDRDDKVLEVGTGSGYQAAVLSEIVGHVYSIEIVEDLGLRAQERLRALGYENVTVKIGDGYAGWEDHAPFDAVIVTAGAPHIPPPLIEQLKPGGRLVIPVGPPSEVQELRVIEKVENGEVRERTVMPVRFVPLTGTHADDAP